MRVARGLVPRRVPALGLPARLGLRRHLGPEHGAGQLRIAGRAAETSFEPRARIPENTRYIPSVLVSLVGLAFFQSRASGMRIMLRLERRKKTPSKVLKRLTV